MGKSRRGCVLVSTLLVLLLLPACNHAQSSTLTPSASLPAPTPTPGANTEASEPVLSDALIPNCTAEGFASDKIGLLVGEKAINFTLKDVKDNEVRLSRLLAEKPVVLIFGSFS